MLSHRHARKTARQWVRLVAVASIVIASGRSGRELRERFSQHSRVAILVKPYTAQLLLEALAEVGVAPATVQ